MGLREAVFAEAQDLPEDRLRERRLVAARDHAVDDRTRVLLDAALATPRRHRAPQPVGLARREAGRDHRDLHHLLLEDRDAERAFEDGLHVVRRIRHGLEPAPPPQVRMDHAALDRTGPHDRDLDHEIVEAPWFQPRQHAHLRARLDLEHAHRVGAAQHVVRRRVFRRDVVQAEGSTRAGRHHRERATDRRQHAEREDVDLQQAQRIEIVLVPLDHAAIGHRGVLDRHEPRERPARHDESADVLREVPRESDERPGERQQLPHPHRGGVEADLAQAVLDDGALVPEGEVARDAVDLLEVETERLADVAVRALRPVAHDRRGERGAVAAVLRVDVLDDLLAAFVLEVDVDVRRLVALARDEALEQHRHPRGVDLRDAERVADGGVRRGPAALAQDGGAAREADDVEDRQEVRFVAQLGDERQLVLDERADGRGAGRRDTRCRRRRVTGGRCIFAAPSCRRGICGIVARSL